jgi:hypothetical protein
MVESVLPKNLFNKVSFNDLLRIEDSSLLLKKRDIHKKTLQESVFLQLYKLFPEEGKHS